MNDTENVGSILHPASILHPILHRKSPMYKGIFMDGCRNVGEDQKTFFEEQASEMQNIGLL